MMLHSTVWSFTSQEAIKAKSMRRRLESDYDNSTTTTTNSSRRRTTMKRTRFVVATFAIFAALLSDMDGSLALSPNARTREHRRAAMPKPSLSHNDETVARTSTELNVAMSPETLFGTALPSLKLPKQVQVNNPLKRKRLIKPSDIMKRPSRRTTTIPVSLDKTHPKQTTLMRRKGKHTSAAKRNGTTVGARVATTKRDDLLSKEEEKVLTRSIRSLRRAIRIRDELVQDEDSIPSEAEWAEACNLSVIGLRRVMYEGQQARTMLVAANTGLVTSIAKRHYMALKQATEAGGGVGTILTLQDMVQEGNLGLMQAAERFEPERDLKFSTYATYWIRQRVLRSISDSSRVIRLPAHVHSMLQKINKAKKDMIQMTGREPSAPELAHYLEIGVEDLKKMASRARNVVSLENPLRSGGSIKEDLRTIGDLIASDAPTPEEDAQNQYLKSDIRAVVNELADRERDVLILRFGLEDGKSMTVNQTAKRLGISSDRVRLVEARAINKLRSPQRNYRLKEYISAGAEEETAEEELNPYPERPEKLWFF